MMHTLMQMRYPLTCQPLDVSIPDSVTFSPSGTPSPPSFTFVNRYYEPMMSTPRLQNNKNMYHQQKGSGMPDMTGPKSSLKMTSKKRDFTINAILGLDRNKSDKTSPSVSRICDDGRREHRVLSPKSYGVPTATTRQNLPVLFPESIENESKVRNEESDVDTRYTLLGHSSNGNSKLSNSSQKSPTHHGVNKAKRVRTIFTANQLERLELEFERQQYMVGPERMYLASALNLTESQVKIWFQNRRIKWRKVHLEMQQARLAQLRETDTAESESDPDQSSMLKDVSPAHWDLTNDRN